MAIVTAAVEVAGRVCSCFTLRSGSAEACTQEGLETFRALATSRRSWLFQWARIGTLEAASLAGLCSILEGERPREPIAVKYFFARSALNARVEMDSMSTDRRDP